MDRDTGNLACERRVAGWVAASERMAPGCMLARLSHGVPANTRAE